MNPNDFTKILGDFQTYYKPISNSWYDYSFNTSNFFEGFHSSPYIMILPLNDFVAYISENNNNPYNYTVEEQVEVSSFDDPDPKLIHKMTVKPIHISENALMKKFEGVIINSVIEDTNNLGSFLNDMFNSAYRNFISGMVKSSFFESTFNPNYFTKEIEDAVGNFLDREDFIISVYKNEIATHFRYNHNLQKLEKML